MTEKQMRILSVVATLTAVGMYVSYIPQIQNNLAGNPGSPLQPLVAAINCTLWVAYGFLKEKRDYPIILANGRLKKSHQNINGRNFSGSFLSKGRWNKRRKRFFRRPLNPSVGCVPQGTHAVGWGCR